jgi:Domain of unknown function (DUF4177)
MKKFEYKVLKTKQEGFWDPTVNQDSLAVNLNNLGALGWELTSAIETNTYQGATKEIVLFLKREIN